MCFCPQLGEIDLAVQDFEMAQSLRAYDPYSTACHGISLVHQGLVMQSKNSEQEAKERMKQGLSELTSAVSVVSRSSSTGEELAMPELNGRVDVELQELTLPSYAYDPFFLRGRWPGRHSTQHISSALETIQAWPNLLCRITTKHCRILMLLSECGPPSSRTLENFSECRKGHEHI